MDPRDIVAAIGAARGTAIMRATDTELAREAMAAALRGGFRCAEVTMTTPGALTLIEELTAQPDVLVGAGTVLTAEQAREAARAGAQFLVSPVVDVDVIRTILDLGCVAVPGTYSPTEMYQAHRAGAQLQKLFPVTAGGPEHVRSVLGPLPMLRIVPTNGVDADNAGAYLEAGAFAVGFVRSLFDPADMGARAFDRIEERARRICARLAAAPTA